MTNVLLISEAQIKEASILEQNVDAKQLGKIIQNVQELQLKAILGKSLYDEVIEEIRQKILDNTYVLTDYYTELVNDYIIPFLINAVIAEFIILNNFKLSNKGVMKLSDNSAGNSSSQDIEYIKNYYDNYAATYKNRLIHFISHTDDITSHSEDTDVVAAAIGWHLEKPSVCNESIYYSNSNDDENSLLLED